MKRDSSEHRGNGHAPSNGTGWGANRLPGTTLPPHSIQAEQGVLGSVLLDNSVLPAVLSTLRAEDFYRAAHQTVYRAILALHDKVQAIDTITLADELTRRDELDAAGGIEYIAELVNNTPHSANAEHYRDIVAERADRRSLLGMLDKACRDSLSNQATANVVIDEVMAGFSEIRNRATSSRLSVTTCLADIEPRDLEWLWLNRVPLGCLTTFAGPGGLGKSLVTLDMAARITTGKPFPDTPDEPNPVGSVILLATEDPLDTVIVPRLIQAGADRSRIRTLSPEVMGRFTLNDVETLGRAVAETPDVRLIIIDPPTALTGGIDDHKNAPLRGLLRPLEMFATQHNVAILFITHISKNASTRAADKVIGSVAWVNGVRAAWMFSKSPHDKKVRRLLSIKPNLGPEMPGLSYRIAPDAPQVIWEQGVLDMDADEAAAEDAMPRGPEPVKCEKDAHWLRELLEAGPMVLSDIIEAARIAGRLPAPTKAKPKPSISPIYNARDRIPKLFAGQSIEEFEVTPGARPRKHWRPVGANVPPDDGAAF